MEKDGNLVAGPFSSREDCLKLFNPISAGGPNAHASVWTQTQSSFDDCDQTPAQKADGRRSEAKAESTDIRQMNVSPKRRSGHLDLLLQGSACLHGQVSPNDAVARPLPPPSTLEP